MKRPTVAYIALVLLFALGSFVFDEDRPTERILVTPDMRCHEPLWPMYPTDRKMKPRPKVEHYHLCTWPRFDEGDEHYGSTGAL